MYTISNNYIKAQFLPKGAELCSLMAQNHQTEYIWQCSAWPKHSPILFPIVGALRGGIYKYEHAEYALGRHGFARDLDFDVVSHEVDKITFELVFNDATLKIYPFRFKLTIAYSLIENSLTVDYLVENLDDVEMPFSIGAHPAFNVPLDKELQFEDYRLTIHLDESVSLPIKQYALTDEGLTKQEGTPFLTAYQNEIPLRYDLFAHDAIVLKEIHHAQITINSSNSEKSVMVTFKDSPYLGIWNKYGSNFVCIEPWHGITDRENADQHIAKKEGIILLSPLEKWTGGYTIAIK